MTKASSQQMPTHCSSRCRKPATDQVKRLTGLSFSENNLRTTGGSACAFGASILSARRPRRGYRAHD